MSNVVVLEVKWCKSIRLPFIIYGIYFLILVENALTCNINWKNINDIKKTNHPLPSNPPYINIVYYLFFWLIQEIKDYVGSTPTNAF